MAYRHCNVQFLFIQTIDQMNLVLHKQVNQHDQRTLLILL